MGYRHCKKRNRTDGAETEVSSDRCYHECGSLGSLQILEDSGDEEVGISSRSVSRGDIADQQEIEEHIFIRAIRNMLYTTHKHPRELQVGVFKLIYLRGALFKIKKFTTVMFLYL